MMRRRALLAMLEAVLVAGGVAGCLLVCESDEAITEYVAAGRPPRIWPDYAGTVLPPNIAPVNFAVKEPGERYCVRISSSAGESIEVRSRDGGVRIPPGPWKKLLAANRGGQLHFDVYVREASGAWRRFERISDAIAAEDVDGWLVYRQMPVYNMLWADMTIRQRDLTNYDERVILHNQSFAQGCCNCHTFLHNRPERMLLNVRRAALGGPPGGLVLTEGAAVRNVADTRTAFNPIPAIYLAWHPSGQAVAFSTNDVQQCFHTAAADERDVVDAFSDLGLYLLGSNTVTTTPAISRSDRLETYPAWSHDGRHLYFCSAPVLPIARYKEIRYDLMRVGYRLETGSWDKVELVLSSDRTGRSITLPKISPDGKWLLFCMSDYGNFPAFSSNSDLYLMELATRDYRKLEINSDKADAWHSWSSDGRWIVFSSKRRDGLFARPYLSRFDGSGRFHKPFLLPQQDPAFYESFLGVYNVPEFVTGRVELTDRGIARALYWPAKNMAALLDPRVRPNLAPGAPSKAWSEQMGGFE